MNILLITYQGDMAGSTNSISYLAKGLAERGHTVVVGMRKEALLWQLLEGTKVIRIPMTFRNKIDHNNIRHIAAIVKKYKIQIINAQSSIDRYTTIFARWFYNLNCKIVHTRRQTPLSIGGIIQNTFYIKGTDKIIVVSDRLKEIFIQKGFPPKHLHVIYNGIPIKRYKNEVSEKKVEALRKKYNIKTTDRVIGCISRYKRQEQIIQALPYLDEKIKVLFVGCEKEDLQKHIDKVTFKNELIFAGKISPDEVLNHYKLMDVNVLPSITDGFGLVLVEAMAMGIPVIGTQFAGIISVLKENEQNGLLFEDNNIPQLVEKLKKFYTINQQGSD